MSDQLVAEVNGLHIAYWREGAGPALVLLHGFITDARIWKHQIAGLSDDFDVIAWDNPGCGKSGDTGEHTSMADYADILASFLDEIGISTAHFCGLSWGTTLALEFYRRDQARVKSLTLADGYAGWTGSLGSDAASQRLARCLKESELPPDEWVRAWAPEAFSPHVAAALLEEYVSMMWDFHPVGFRAMSRAFEGDFSDVLPIVAVPTLLLWGECDSRSPVAIGERMRDQILGSVLKIIPRAGHVSSLEQPELFNDEVRAFILGCEGN